MQPATDRRNGRARRPLTWFALSALAALGACSAGDEGAEGATTGPENEAAAEASVAVGVADTAQQEAAKVQEERVLRERQSEVLVKAYLDSAQANLDAQDYDRAETSILQALMLRPNDGRGIELFRKVMTLRNRKMETAEDVVEMVRNRRELARQQKQVEVKQNYVEATHAEAAGRYDVARQKLEDAQLAMRFDPYETDFGALKMDVDDLHRLVTRRLEASRKAAESEEFGAAYRKMQSQEEEARKREDARVREHLIASMESFNRGEYDNAEHQANMVLRLRRDNMKAQEIVTACRGARHEAWRERFLQSRREEFERWMVDVRDAQIPSEKLLVFPDVDEWARIKARADLGDHVDKASMESSAEAAIRARLANEVISLDYGETPTTFKEAIRDFRNRRGINIVVDPDVMTEKGEEPVNLTLIDFNLGEALNVLLANLKLGYVLADDVLKITSIEKAQGRPLPRVYEVRDLTVALGNFAAPNLSLRPGPAGESALIAIRGEMLEPTTPTEINSLIELIRDTCGPGTWESEGHSINPSAGQLVVSTTPAVHKQVKKILADLRKFNKLTVHVEARFLSVTKGFLQDIGVDFRGGGGQNPGSVALLDDVTNGVPNNASAGLDNGQPGLPSAGSLHPTNGAFYNNDATHDIRGRTENILDSALGTLLDSRGGATASFSILNSDIKINALLRAVEKSIDQTLVNAPRLTIYNRQRANLSIINQVSYVKDYDVEVAQSAFIADPLVDIVQDGLTLDVLPTVSFDRKYVKLDLRPTVATLIRPIRTFETNLSGLTVPVIIELPEVSTRSAQTTVTVPDGGWVVIGGLRHVTTVDLRSSTPILGDIPIIGFLFTRKGRSDEIRDLMIIMHVRIVDLTEEEKGLIR